MANKNNTAETRTDLVFIIDKSGSMGGLEADTLKGYNGMLSKQRELPGKARVTTVLFDDTMSVLVDRQSLEDTPDMLPWQYRASGCTALLDAVGATVKRINAAQKADPAGRPDSTVVVITTDGQENASSKYSFAKVKKMVEKRTAKNGWEFVFLGANMDAISAAADLGIGAQRAATYVHDSIGTSTIFAAANEAMSCARACRPIDAGWKSKVEEDYAARG